jgi:hypothetical protein
MARRLDAGVTICCGKARAGPPGLLLRRQGWSLSSSLDYVSDRTALADLFDSLRQWAARGRADSPGTIVEAAARCEQRLVWKVTVQVTGAAPEGGAMDRVVGEPR